MHDRTQLSLPAVAYLTRRWRAFMPPLDAATGQGSSAHLDAAGDPPNCACLVTVGQIGEALPQKQRLDRGLRGFHGSDFAKACVGIRIRGIRG